MPKHKELREQLGIIVRKVKEYAVARGYWVLHIIPNAYCIARPSYDTAVFAVAPPDRPRALAERGQVLVQKGVQDGRVVSHCLLRHQGRRLV